jgi:hypothetical protein
MRDLNLLYRRAEVGENATQAWSVQQNLVRKTWVD